MTGADMKHPKDIVREGYDKVSFAYRSDEPHAAALSHYEGWLNELTPLLPTRASILDLGCGCGVPVAHILTGRGFAVTGADISPVQISRARAAVPNAEFVCADMTTLTFPAQTFAAVVALYAIIHVPLAEQRALFSSIHRWLTPGGWFLATLGAGNWTGTEDNWLNVAGGTMYWSHAAAATYEKWLMDAGFAVQESRFIPEGGSGGHTLFWAQKKIGE